MDKIRKYWDRLRTKPVTLGLVELYFNAHTFNFLKSIKKKKKTHNNPSVRLKKHQVETVIKL